MNDIKKSIFFYVGILVSVLSGVLILFVGQHYGPGLTADAIEYVSMAENLAKGDGWIGYGGNPTQLYPPFLSFMLAVFPAIGIDPIVGGRYLSALLFSSTLMLAAYWLYGKLNNPPIALFGVLSLATAFPLLNAFGYVLTEPPFILLVLATLLVSERYLSSGSIASLAGCGVLVAVSGVTRYAGVTLGLTVGVLILFFSGKSIREKIKDLSVFGVISSSLILLWMFRNWLIYKTPLGRRPWGALESPLETIDRSWRVIKSWGWPNGVGEYLFPTVTGAALVGGVFIALSARWVGSWKNTEGPRYFPWPFVVFLCVYIPFIVYVKTRVGMMEPRYLTPALPVLFLLVVYFFDASSVRLFSAGRWGRGACYSMWVCMCVWLALTPGMTAYMFSKSLLENGWTGINSKEWRETDVHDFLSNWSQGGTLWATAPAAVYLYSGRKEKVARIPPASTAKSVTEINRVKQIATTLLSEKPPLYIVYMRNQTNGGWDKNYITPTELSGILKLKPYWTAPDYSAVIFKAVGVRS